MPLTPAMRPVTDINMTAAAPISAPPSAEATGVKEVSVIQETPGFALTSWRFGACSSLRYRKDPRMKPASASRLYHEYPCRKRMLNFPLMSAVKLHGDANIILRSFH